MAKPAPRQALLAELSQGLAMGAGELAACEAVVNRFLLTWAEAGSALSRIRDRLGYRAAGFDTFEDYCRERWGFSRGYSYDLMAAAEVAENVRTCVQPTPSFSQARELRSLPPEQQRELAERVDFSETPVRELREIVREVRADAPSVQPSMAVHYSSETPEWYTPPELIACVVATLGRIDLDPCSNVGRPNVPAASHFTVDHDGLSLPWSGLVYMNPPYGDGIGRWVEKLRAEYLAGNVTAAIALVPARTDTAWFAALRDGAICFVRGRLRFSGHQNSAPFPSAAVYFGPDAAAFVAAFQSTGDVWTRLSN